MQVLAGCLQVLAGTCKVMRVIAGIFERFLRGAGTQWGEGLALWARVHAVLKDQGADLP